jgi:hypothetical protein
MQLNNVNLADRHNRPTVLEKVALRAFFINSGEYYDPYDISGVTVFSRSANLTPNSVITDNVVASSVTASQVKMHFTASANDSGAALAATSYNPDTDPNCTSGIFRVDTGEYVCVLDGANANLSGNYDLNGSSFEVLNTTSAVGDYIDVWTIQFAQGSVYRSIVNDFSLYDDTFFAITQPLIFSVQNRLVNKHLQLSSVENLKFPTEITITNKDIDTSLKNLFQDSSLITNATVEIQKVNEGSVALPSHVTVVSHADTSGLLDVTSDNTIIYRFDTATLINHAQIAQFNGVVGTYRATLKYTLMNETIVSPPYYFVIS